MSLKLGLDHVHSKAWYLFIQNSIFAIAYIIEGKNIYILC